jgi:hypothetical protein
MEKEMSEKDKRKLRRKLRKEKKAQEKEVRSTQKVELHADCMVCGKPIGDQSYRKVPPDSKCDYWRFYHIESCGPGTEAWFKFHPSQTAKILMQSKEVVKDKRALRRERRKQMKGGGVSVSVNGNGEVVHSTTNQITQKEDVIMAKKEETKKAKGEGLKPMTPVVIPGSVMKQQSKEVQKMLKELSELDRSSKDAAKIRKALRKAGFKLSDYRGESAGEKKAETKKEAPAAAPKKEKKAKAAPPEPVEED